MKKILIIEDTPDVLAFVGNALQANGFETVCASDGLEGIRLAGKQMPDLILCDVIMPILDGYGTLAALRKDERTAHIPLIFLTGNGDRPQFRQGMELGADDYLTKPFTMEELIRAVNSRLQKQAVLSARSERKLEELRGNIRFALPHELMTPLTCILGFSSMLTESSQTLTPAQVLEFGTHINTAATRLQVIIENFLLFSHLEVIGLDPEKAAALRELETIATRPALDRAMRQVLKRHSDRTDDFQFSVTDCAHGIAPTHLEKIAHELLDNAFKFSAQGSKVILQTTQHPDRFEVLVVDHGRGMAKEQIQQVGAHMQFERNIHEQQGPGLGLAISQRLVRLYNGDLQIESEPGRRTIVTVQLPRRAES